MDSEVLRCSVDVLKDIRTEINGTVENTVVDQLDKAIQDLESALQVENETAIEAVDILALLGNLILRLPEIAEAIEYLVQLIDNNPN